MADMQPERSTFHTKDTETALASSDPYFRPVDVKLGPDGAVYIADWCDAQIAHTRNQEGQIDKSNGRIYRLVSVDKPPQPRESVGNARSSPAGAGGIPDSVGNALSGVPESVGNALRGVPESVG